MLLISRLIRAALSCLLLATLAAPLRAHAATEDSTTQPKVVIQLRGVPQFQFAGYYAALWQGYYADEGLQVELRPGITPDGRSVSTTTAVASGRAQFGVGSSDILVARDQGADLVILNSFLQWSPFALYLNPALPETSLRSLREMRFHEPDLSAQWHEALALGLSMLILPHELTVTDRGAFTGFQTADALLGSVLSTPWTLAERGIPYREVRPRDYGVEFPGDTLFTTRALLDRDPALVERIMRASVKGWTYALSHSDEVAGRMVDEFPNAFGRASAVTINRSQIDKVKALTGWPLVKVGDINPARWQAVHETLRRLNLVHGPLELEDFAFDSVRLEQDRAKRLRHGLTLGIAILSVLLFSAGTGAWLMRRALLQRQSALTQAEDRYRQVLDSVPDHAIFAMDANGIITNWNDGADRLLGYSRAAVLGRPVAEVVRGLDLLGGDLVPPSLSTGVRLIPERSSGQGWLMRADGSRFWGEWVLSPVTARDPDADSGQDHPGYVPGYVQVIRDISARKRSEDRIRFQAGILDQASSAILATDIVGRLVYLNAMARRVFLIGDGVAVGRRLEELGILPRLTAPAHPGQPEQREVTAHRPDGVAFPALVTSATIDEAHTGDRYIVHLVHDLTERKALEAEVQHSANLALLGKMSASLAHEINQPLNVIRLSAEGCLLRLDQGRLDPAELTERLKIISSTAAGLFDTIDFMQVFARRERTADLPVPTVTFDLWHSVDAAVATVAEEYRRSGIPLEVDRHDLPVLGHGRPRQVEQALVNLLTNALHAVSDRPDGAPRRVQVRVNAPLPAFAGRTANGLTISVADSGPGIPPSVREQVFEPFYTTKAAGKGTGLGLAISRDILRAMEGDLHALTSPELGGACMVLEIPPAPCHDSTSDDLHHTADAPGGDSDHPHGHILVVDDEPLARTEIADGLRHSGWLVSTAHGGHPAIALLEQANGDRPGTVAGTEIGRGADRAGPQIPPVDIVVTDIHMPEGSGIELAERIADDYPQVFVIVMTGQPQRGSADLEGLGADVDLVMRKPISLRELDARLHSLMDTTAEEPDPAADSAAPG
ncbi:ABC transporter substrate-binding protein [Novispirillum itersonii]|uniref:ABC transporter substrate-binding protein n=1 Tax=Novispirillum itersonii TaxID=189 RepID=UPI00035D99A3|nr:ABC transporter substrate-binding protein [Novispirillum itersonii]